MIKRKLTIRYLLMSFISLLAMSTMAQKTENIIIITTDGLRWQELFGGMDTALANNPLFNEDDSLLIYQKYDAITPEEKRKKLMPFFWSTIVSQGQVFGNRWQGNKVDLANPYRYSYAGYSELMTGFVDSTIKSNNHPANTNENVLAFLNKQPKLTGKVAAFAAWHAFDRILNEEKSGFPVINAFDTVGGSTPTENEKLINAMLKDSYKPWGDAECLDIFTHYGAMEWLKVKQPSVLYIAYGETDEWAHSGKYRSYLDAANQVDKWIEEIWLYLQKHPHYKNNTSLVIASDHGRGDKVKKDWTSHGGHIEGAEEVWLAVIGPDIKPKGEAKTKTTIYQKQIAATIAQLMGFEFKTNHPVANSIKSIWEK